MFIIGIDPHKGSHTAAVLDAQETLVGELRVVADRRQRERLLDFAASFEPRRWAVEAAGGLGALLAQQLVAAGETVLDVPPALSARARLPAPRRRAALIRAGPGGQQGRLHIQRDRLDTLMPALRRSHSRARPNATTPCFNAPANPSLTQTGIAKGRP